MLITMIAHIAFLTSTEEMLITKNAHIPLLNPIPSSGACMLRSMLYSPLLNFAQFSSLFAAPVSNYSCPVALL